MSYSIIFQTIVLRLPDGRVLHLDRSGCNNDSSGRDKHSFYGKIYTEADFIAYAQGFKADSAPYKESGSFELKIGSRPASMYDYGEHLLRMLKRAPTYADFCKKHTVYVNHLTGIHMVKPEEKDYTPDEFTTLQLSGGLPREYTYYYCWDYIKDLSDIVHILETDRDYAEVKVCKLPF